MKTLAIWIPSYNMHVSVSDYVKAIKKAKNNPTAEFPRTLCKWWGGTGAEIVKEFTVMIHDKINENKPGQFIGVSAS